MDAVCANADRAWLLLDQVFLIEKEAKRVSKWETILRAALPPDHPLLNTLIAQIAVRDITDFDDGCLELYSWSVSDGAKPAFVCSPTALTLPSDDRQAVEDASLLQRRRLGRPVTSRRGRDAQGELPRL